MDRAEFAVVGLFLALWMLMSLQMLTASEKPQGIRQYEVCRDKLFTPYPEEVNQQTWRNCING
jgi:hypothetical protein|tara:strand:+ start:543 stop:731 length:189 start_codon:yes stop_codon:yes gene_type:complete